MTPANIQIDDRIETLADRYVPRFEVYFARESVKPTKGASKPPIEGTEDAARAEAERIRNKIFRAGSIDAIPTSGQLVPLAGPWGERAEQQTNDVISVEFTESVEKDAPLTKVTIELLNVYDFRTGRYRYTDIPQDLPKERQGLYPLLEYGDTIAILFGYAALEPVFEGVITTLEVTFPADGEPHLTITAVDKRDRLRNQKDLRPKRFVNMSEEQIAAVIAAQMGLSVCTRPGQRTQPNGPVQMPTDQDALQFLTDRAKKAGLEMTCFGDTIFLLTPGDVATKALRYEYRRGLTSLTPKFNGAGKPTRVKVVSRDPSTQKTYSGEAGPEDLQREGLAPPGRAGSTALDAIQRSGQAGERTEVVTNYLAKSDQEAKQIALGILKRNLDETFTVSGELIGDPAVRVGTTLQIEGVGRYSGPYYVTQATHRFGANGYQTSFQARRNSALGASEAKS